MDFIYLVRQISNVINTLENENEQAVFDSPKNEKEITSKI